MARERGAVCVALLLLIGGSAQAAAESASKKCVENPDTPWEGGDPALGACRKCADSGSKCKECWTGWSLNKKGECVKCTGNWCFACDPEKPSVCKTCGDWSGESFTGYFARHDGKCEPCPEEDCMQCKNGSGRCTLCTTGMGVIDNTCKPCKHRDRCITCNGDLAVCTECFSGYWLHKSGRCKRCPAHCDKCTNSKHCTECSSEGYALDKKTKKCVPCSSKGCTYCPHGKDKCQTCDMGYTMMPDRTCAPCAAEHCTTCKKGDPSVCKICAYTSPDPWWGGPNADRDACVPCKAKQCAACQTRWDKCDWCQDGFFNDAKLKDCTPCKERWPHCTTCGMDATKGDPGIPACFGCEEGWDTDPDAPDGKCIRAN